MDNNTRSNPANLSFWEHNHLFAQVDFCIVGAGIVGLHTALFLKQQQPTAKILVLEKSPIGAAASSKNAGFACFGSVSEILDDIELNGSEMAYELIKMRWDGLQLLINVHGSDTVGFEKTGGYELFRKKDQELYHKCAELIPELNKNLDFIGSDVYSTKASSYPFRNIEWQISTSFEGQIDTTKMYFNLEHKALNQGILILRGFEVKTFQDTGAAVEIEINPGIVFKTRQLAITNNGFAASLLPKADVKPARAQVLVTEPIPGFELNGTFHYDKGYYYFRNCGNRLLIGGGRNVNFVAEETTEQRITEEIQNSIEELMYNILLKEPVKIDFRWAGTMGIGMTKYPIIEQISNRVFCGVRMGGMGVAIGALVGKKLSDLISKT